MPRPVFVFLLAAFLAASACPRAGAQSACAAQLSAAAQGGGSAVPTLFLDPDTPAAACTKPVCTGAYTECDVSSPPTEDLQLVFSDEFNQEGRQFGVGAGDPRWTADRMWYAGTDDMEVYVPEQVQTVDGAAVITIERATNATALSQQPNGVVWNVSKDFRSGFVSSWNKFCFTGGYMETRVWLPGDDFASGFWPAFWLMGNLGRAGHMATTSGFWPYTYTTQVGDERDGGLCGGGDVGTDQPAGPTPQNITACPDPPGFDRTKFGLEPGVGRGAPEIDLLEVKVDSSIGHQRGDPQGGEPGQQRKPFSSITLQTAPLLPNGTTWTATDANGEVVPGPDWAYTHLTYWQGEYGSNLLDRPGNLYQDSVSAYCVLDPSFWTSYHTFGLHWVPGDYVRWYVDGHFVYEVNKEALRAQSNGTYSTGERLIPEEAMYIIFNLAMSNSFSTVDLEQLQFPSQYKVDYVRVYQPAAAINIGCSPKEYPTEQYLACNRDKYLLTGEEADLITAPCLNSVSCRQETGVDLQGGNIPSPAGDGTFVQPQQLATVKECCQACQAMSVCGAYVYDPRVQTCYFKASSGWTRAPAPDILSGQVYEAGASWPRNTNSSSSPAPSPGTPNNAAGSAAWLAGTWRKLLLLALFALVIMQG